VAPAINHCAIFGRPSGASVRDADVPGRPGLATTLVDPSETTRNRINCGRTLGKISEQLDFEEK